MKVLIIPSWYPTEENPILGIFFKEQAVALKKAGCDVTVLYPEIRTARAYQSDWKKGLSFQVEDWVPTYRYKAYNFIPARVPYATAMVYSQKLKKLYREYVKKEGKPDVIHAHSCLWGGWAATKIAREENIPVVLTEHSSKLGRGLLKPYEAKELRHTLAQTDRIISVGPGLKKELEARTEKAVIEIPNIVNFERFQVGTLSKTERGAQKFRFFTLALLTRNKGMDVLIKSFAKVFKGKEEVELVIGGEGEHKDDLTKLTRELGLESQVTFLGGLDRSQVVQEMHASDVFVLASKYETFGVVFIEALASGKPVISTRSGGPESIINDNNGLLVPVDDQEALSRAMSKMYEEYSSYDQEEIRNDCLNRFSEKVIVEKIMNVYNEMV